VRGGGEFNVFLFLKSAAHSTIGENECSVLKLHILKLGSACLDEHICFDVSELLLILNILLLVVLDGERQKIILEIA